MAGNPNHDARGRFASKSGLNKANSTVTQRGKAAVKEHISAGKAFAGAAVAAAAGAAGAALLQGISRPIRFKGAQLSHQAIAAAEAHATNLVARHGPSVAGAIKNAIPFAKHHAPNIAKAILGKGSTLTNHVANMKAAGAAQHSVSSVSSSVKPRVRVQAPSAKIARVNVRVKGSAPSSTSYRVPMGRK